MHLSAWRTQALCGRKMHPSKQILILFYRGNGAFPTATLRIVQNGSLFVVLAGNTSIHKSAGLLNRTRWPKQPRHSSVRNLHVLQQRWDFLTNEISLDRRYVGPHWEAYHWNQTPIAPGLRVSAVTLGQPRNAPLLLGIDEGTVVPSMQPPGSLIATCSGSPPCRGHALAITRCQFKNNSGLALS